MKNILILILIVVVAFLGYRNNGLGYQVNDYTKGLWACFQERDSYLEELKQKEGELIRVKLLNEK